MLRHLTAMKVLEPDVIAMGDSVTLVQTAKAVLTDSHFLIPLAVLFIGLGLLIALH